MSALDKNPPTLLNLIALAAVGPMALNLLFPSMPGMVVVFDTNYGVVQLTFIFYMVSLAVAQLFVGPVSDWVGRRPVVLWGMVICMTGSIICIFAPSIEVLIAGRVVQAIGACAGLVMARTIIRDMHGVDKAAAMIGYLSMAMVVAPMISPYVGAMLDDAYGWQASFVLVLSVTTMVLAISFVFLGESHKGPYQVLSVGTMLSAFVVLMKMPRFVRHTMQISLSSAAFFAFLGGAPYVSINLMGLTKTQYGLYFLIGGFGYMCGNFVTGRMSERWGAERLITLGTGVGTLGGAVLVVAYISDYFIPATMFGGMWFIAFGNGLCLPSGTAGAISADKNRIGAAAGLAGFMQMAIGALSSYVVGIVMTDTALPLVVVMASSVTLAFAGNLMWRRGSV